MECRCKWDREVPPTGATVTSLSIRQESAEAVVPAWGSGWEGPNVMVRGVDGGW